MSTQEAIRIGTATTGRLITGAALVAVVGRIVRLSDLVVMKCLAFRPDRAAAGRHRDPDVPVPAVMKLFGDDCCGRCAG